MDKKQENLITIGITILWITVITAINIIPAATPDFSQPPGPLSTESSTEPITNNTTTPTTTITTTRENNNNVVPFNAIYATVKVLFFIMLIVVAYFLYRFIIANYQGFKITGEKEDTTLKEKVISLENASQTAEQILKQALQTGEYTKAVIEAYHVLDMELAHFRNAARPKHWTPKEYAYKVKEPVYQEAVRGIVEIFYKVRYAKKPATKQDVLDFLLFLKGLFTSSLTEEIQHQIKSRLPAKIEEDAPKEIIIPRVLDFTKPFKTFYREKRS